MSETPVSRDPGPDGDPSGVPAGPGDHPWLGSPDWALVPQRPDWDEAYLAAMADDEDPGARMSTRIRADLMGGYASRAAGFATGKPLDLTPGCPVLAQLPGDAAGDQDR